MSAPPFIALNYGPYEANGVISHKIQRLHGILGCLSKCGYEIEIIPTIHINRLTIEILGRSVFRCDIRNLPFNLDCDDILCKRIVKTVHEAVKRMYNDNIQQHSPYSKGLRVMQQIKYARNAQDLFSSNADVWYEIAKRTEIIGESKSMF